MIYTVLDLETTGVDTLNDEPVQIAALSFAKASSSYQEVQSMNTLVLPTVEISPKAEAVHGLSLERLKEEGMPVSKAVAEFLNLIWRSQPCCLVGYNLINFDFPMLWNWLARHNASKFKFPPISQIYDAMFMAQAFFGMRKWPKLSETANKLGISYDPGSLHDALVDVELTWKCFRKLMKME